MSEELATQPVGKPTTVKGWINSPEFQAQIAAALPSICTPKRFIRVALTALLKTPDLAKCEPMTVIKCLLDCGSLGLEPDGRRAHLIPFKNRRKGITECTLIFGYQGLAELALRSGSVVSILPEAVHEKDAFEYGVRDGRPILNWTPARKERGEITHFFATASLKGDGVQYAVMTREEVESIRDGSQGYKYAKSDNRDHPWISQFGEMGKKTVVRRLVKILPQSPELRDAIEKDDEAEPVRTFAREVPDFPAVELSDCSDDEKTVEAGGAA